MDPTETTHGGPARTGDGGTGVVWPAVAAGSGVGLAVLVAVATTRAVLDDRIEDFDETGWTIPLFVLLLAGYFAAGWVAQRRAARAGTPDAPFTHGVLAGLGAFVAWVPLRIAIWLVRDEDRALFRGAEAALRPGQVFGALVIAAGVGMLGGFLASRRSTSPAASGSPGSPGSEA